MALAAHVAAVGHNAVDVLRRHGVLADVDGLSARGGFASVAPFRV